MQNKNKLSKINRVMLKGHRSQHEGVLIRQSIDNVSLENIILIETHWLWKPMSSQWCLQKANLFATFWGTYETKSLLWKMVIKGKTSRNNYMPEESQDPAESSSCWLNVEGKWDYKITFVQLLVQLIQQKFINWF